MKPRRHLSPTVRESIFDRASGRCHLCSRPIRIGQRWEVSHIIPLALGGADDETNYAPAHAIPCHRDRTANVDLPMIAKAKRVRRKHIGAHRAAKPLPAGRGSRVSKKITGEVVVRMSQSEKHAAMMAKRRIGQCP